MSDQNDKAEIAQLEQLNAELKQSLTRCRKLLFVCRSQLAANSNAPERQAEETEQKRR